MFDDPAIKLFGKTIPLSESDSPPFPPPPLLLVDEESNASSSSSSSKDAGGETTKSEACDSLEEESCKPDKSSALDIGKGKNGKTASLENKATMDAKLEKDKLKTDSDGQEKVLKKPDTIIPCPRCNSLETKFCYYNNYNVNQPRHFCKNCQRYWTAGGTMRNVPPGAGRRKHKNIASEYRHVVASSDGIPATTDDTPDLATHQVNSCGELSPPSGTCNGNGTVLKFRPDPALCKSIAAVLNLRSQKRNNEMGVAVCGGNRDEPSSCGSSVSDPTCSKIELPDNEAQMEQDSMSGSCDKPTPHAPPNPLQCYPCSPWAYPWNSGSNSVASIAAGGCSSEMFYGMGSGDLKQVAWGSTPMVVTPTYITPSIPFPFVPASYWGCMNSSWTTGAWNVPWSGSNRDHLPSSYSSISGSSSNSFPTLGKRSREANIEGEGEGKSEKCLWVPKTLRIDDPDEAAKSSIWDTLGIKPGQSELISKGGIFKAFQPKKVVNDDALDPTQALQANPAALSRSQKFQESS